MVKNELTVDQREKQEAAQRKYAASQNEKAREAQLELARIQAQAAIEAKPDPWPSLKSIAYAPCYLFAIFVVGTLALFKREIPQALIDFLNS